MQVVVNGMALYLHVQFGIGIAVSRAKHRERDRPAHRRARLGVGPRLSGRLLISPRSTRRSWAA
jgi:hypothetical protein